MCVFYNRDIEVDNGLEIPDMMKPESMAFDGTGGAT
jgi:hypothetical protein